MLFTTPGSKTFGSTATGLVFVEKTPEPFFASLLPLWIVVIIAKRH